MAHTPGPWAIREPEDGELHEVYAENGGDLICYPVYTANQKANIPLIAAAPDLLAALRMAVDYANDTKDRFSQHWDSDDEDSYSALLDASGAAIDKAEGRSE